MACTRSSNTRLRARCPQFWARQLHGAASSTLGAIIVTWTIRLPINIVFESPAVFPAIVIVTLAEVKCGLKQTRRNFRLKNGANGMA
jgi:hypothetical protein